jgi:HEAT repeat protein
MAMMKHWRGVGLLLVLLSALARPAGVCAQASNPPPAPPTPAQGNPPGQAPANPQVEQLKSSDPGIRANAARELGKSGDASAIPALVAALKDPNEKVRHEVVIALAQMHQPEALDGLITATQDSDDATRVLAVQGLVGYYTGHLPSPGFSGFVKERWRRVKGHFAVDNTRIDPGLPVEPKVLATLDDTMKDTRSQRAAREAAKGLGILMAQTTVPDLVAAAHASDEELARQALNALAKIKDKSAGPKLLDLLDSPDKDVKRDASVTVGVLRTQDALPKLQAIYESDPDQKNREKAIEGLAYLGEAVSVPLFTKALWSENKTIRTSAAEGLARAADPVCLPELEKAVAAEKDTSAKLAVEYAITVMGKQDYLSAVVSELGSKLRGDAAQAYLIELAREPAFLAKLYPYLQSPDAGVRKRLCTVLMFDGNQPSLEQLDRLSHDPDSEVISEALRAKRAIRVRTPAAAPATAPTPTANP